jgi:PII-like signaling protein
VERSLLSISHDASVMLSVVDSEEKIRNTIPFFDEMMDERPIAMSNVGVTKYVRQEGAWT